MLRFILFVLFVSLCSCNDNCFKKSPERDLGIYNGAFSIVSYDDALDKLRKIVYIPERMYTTQYDILEAIRKVINQNLGVKDNYLTIENHRDRFCFQIKGKLFLILTPNIGRMLATDSLWRFLVPDNTSNHVADIEKRSSDNDFVTSTVSNEIDTHTNSEMENTTLAYIPNNGSTTTKVNKKSTQATLRVAHENTTKTLSKKHNTSVVNALSDGSTTTKVEENSDLGTSIVANETSTQQNYSEIHNITSGNITNNGSTTTKANENSETGSVLVIIEVVFCILAVFAIVLGLIGFVYNVIKKTQELK